MSDNPVVRKPIVRLRFPDYDSDIVKLATPPQFLNIADYNRDDLTCSDIEIINSLLVTKYEGDTIQTIPVCGCGKVRGRPNHGLVCKFCDQVVLSPIERGFESDIWMYAPKGVVSFINPTYFRMLSKALQSTRTNPINLLDYFCNDSYHVRPSARHYAREMDDILRKVGTRRGYNNFINNFSAIMEHLEKSDFIKEKTKKGDIRLLRMLHRSYGKTLFPYNLPLPSKRSIITETSGKVRSTRNDAPLLLDAIQIMYTALNTPTNTLAVTQRNVYKSLSRFAEYYSALEAKTLSRKEGWFRKHIYGSRIGPSFRAVITSLAGVHHHDELHLPFGLAVATYRPYIMNRLLRRDDSGTVNDAERYLVNAINSKIDQSDSPIMAILNDLIREVPHPHKGFPVLFGRNPTLNLRSIQMLYVTKIKSDPLDNTISFSLLALRGPNADKLQLSACVVTHKC